ncbi:MAG: PspC domain-containing protein [Weeksellaceae bacterium]|nr:PspC domain-containing protein [Weeksellaceae bacterium]
MDKTIAISLGGYSFIVDDAAYLKLKQYLDDIRRSLNGMQGVDDVISDIEIRIAELFKQRMGNREVVGLNDVEHIIEVMGTPEQYANEDETQSGDKSTGHHSTSNTASRKKLYRDPDDKVLGGVLSGIAHYIGIETWITRLIWILLFFADIPLTGTSFTIVSYIILWIILPKAETASQKYEMFGEAGNIASIKRSAGSETTKGKRNHSDTFADALKIFGKIILIFIGFVLICIGLSLVIGSIAFISTVGDVPVQFFGRILDFPWQDTLAKVLVVILCGVPGVLFTYLGARLISNRVKVNRTMVFSLSALWFIALLGIIVLGLSTVKSFSRKAEFTERKAYTIPNDTLKLSFNNYREMGKKKVNWSFDFDTDFFAQVDGKLFKNIDSNVEIRQSSTDQIFVDVLYYSKGSSIDDARLNAEQIQYNYAMNTSGELLLNNYLELPDNTKFRNQEVSVIVYVPEGKVIHSTNVKNLIFMDEDLNTKNYKRGTNKFYKFVNWTVECLNCPENSDENVFDEDDDQENIDIAPGRIRIQDGEDQIEINKNKIKISDGTDTINIGTTGN